jgi:heptosyltransferase III
MPGSSPSVLIIRLDAIGDALALTPLLAALRERGIPADVVLRAENEGIFSSRAARTILVAPFDLRSSARATLDAIAFFGSALRARRYTHVLVATEDPGGYRLARATRAPVRVGFSNGWGKPFKTLWARGFLTSCIYRAAGVDARGIPECETLFKLGMTLLDGARPSADPAILRPLVIENEPAADSRPVVQITDKWERLGIELDRVAELVDRTAAYGARFVASAAENEYADAVARAAGCVVERTASLEAWKDALAAAPAVVAPDSGAIHVAGMIGTPTVAVFPPSGEFDAQVARWAPWAAPHRIVKAAGDWPSAATDALAALL